MVERQSVLITGANRGFGRALLDYYSSSGWRVVPLVRNVEIAERLGTDVPNCTPIVGDVTHDNVGTAVKGVPREVGLIIESSMNGKCLDLENETIMKW
jgi:NAD(P)-dependent dehydrogenase (short-subunit alcohol dehydrogenase family)